MMVPTKISIATANPAALGAAATAVALKRNDAEEFATPTIMGAAAVGSIAMAVGHFPGLKYSVAMPTHAVGRGIALGALGGGLAASAAVALLD
jgi:hypothetical protein